MPSEGGILAPNHASFLDPIVIAASCPREIHFLARESLFRKSILRAVITRLNTHPVRQGKSNAGAFKVAHQVLSNKQLLLIFPEGKRCMEGSLQELQPGVAMISAKARVPIIPVYVHGTFKIWPRNRKFPRWRGQVACIFGAPIVWDQFSHLKGKEALVAATKKLSSSMEELSQWYHKEVLDSSN